MTSTAYTASKEDLDFACEKLSQARLALTEFDQSNKITAKDIELQRKRYVLLQLVIEATRDLVKAINRFLDNRRK